MIDVPSVSQMAIEVGAFYIAPEGRRSLKQIHSATSVGVKLDDCIDFVHRSKAHDPLRRVQFFTHGTKMHFKRTSPAFQRIKTSTGSAMDSGCGSKL